MRVEYNQAHKTLGVKLKGSPKEKLAEMASMCDAMKRIGSKKDDPEGSQIVQISDTLMRELADALRGIAKCL